RALPHLPPSPTRRASDLDVTSDARPGGNATNFLAAFNDIEAHLRRNLKARPSDGFKWMVNLSHRKHRLSDAQRSALIAFSDLRKDRKSTRLNSSHVSISY